MRVRPSFSRVSLCALLLAGCGKADGGDDLPDARRASDGGRPDSLPCVDGDGDGFGANCTAGNDCNDEDATINAGADEDCDGIDNDCDEQIDEDLLAPSCDLVEGVCAGGTARCGGTVGWLPCETEDFGPDYEPVEAACDGLDNDCDGFTDEACDCAPGTTQGCGSDVGACMAGVQTCLSGGTWGPCEGDIGPMGEICDGVNNDCDTSTDEPGDLIAPDCPLQEGVCAGSKRTCGGAAGWMACNGTASYGAAYETSETTCDAMDNDCDGIVDEGCICVPGDTQPCGSDVGACQSGVQTCIVSGWGACTGEVTPVAEECNGADDDCDASIDEGLTAPACALQQGVCSGARQVCGGAAGWLACAGTASYGPNYQATESTCDGLDNDCDGTLDEGCPCVVGSMQPCGLSAGLCEPGTQTCTASGWGTCTGGVGPAPEICNGADDDCNTDSDDNLTRPPCALTQGVCAGSLATCGGTAGWLACAGTASYGPSYVMVEDGAANETLCDGLDNDCDGSVDETCSSGPIVTGANDAITPSIFGGHIAYLEHDGTSWDVFLADTRYGTTERLTTTPADEWRPDVYGNIVTYQRGVDAAARVVVYELETGVETVITNTQSELPRVFRNVVVWADGRSGNWDLWGYDLTTGVETQLTSGTANEVGPEIRGDKLIYLSDMTGTWLLHILDLGTGMDTLQNAAAANQPLAVLDWYALGWSDGRNAVAPFDDNANWDLFSATLAAPGTESMLVTAPMSQLVSDLDGTLFVWSDQRNGNWDVGIGAHGGTGELITMSSALQAEPAIHGGVVAWEDNRLGTFDIYGSALGGLPVAEAGEIVINEVLADPGAHDANGDGTASATNDEFVELVNATVIPLDISGFTLRDATGVRHTFAAGTVIPAVSSLVVFGGGGPARAFGGAGLALASTGGLNLNDTGDTVSLVAADGTTVINSVTWGPEGGMDEALVRNPELGTGPMVRHSTATGAGGRMLSPGVAVFGYAF